MSRRMSVFGAEGSIGRHVTASARTENVDVLPIGRGDVWRNRDLGDVIYCVGLTADFRGKPHETVEAHVSFLSEVLKSGRWRSFTYLSSTRVYAGLAQGPAREDCALAFMPGNPDHLYNLSKALGESLTLAVAERLGRRAHVARLSNVYGPRLSSPTFLDLIIEQAVRDGVVRLRSSLDSEKDYVHIDDVVGALIFLSRAGRESIYNIAQGRNTSHRTILERLGNLTGCAVEVEADADVLRFPIVSVERINQDFGPARHELSDALPELVARRHRKGSQ